MATPAAGLQVLCGAVPGGAQPSDPGSVRAFLWDTAPGALAGPPDLAAWPVPGRAIACPGTVAAMWRDPCAGGGDEAALALLRPDARDWWLTLEWVVPDAARAPGGNACLELDGLATHAQVWLNDDLLLDSRSMFVQHRLPVGDRLGDGVNRVTLCFRSLDAALQARSPRPRWRAPMIESQSLRLWRTTVLGRTPGWSPPVPIVGPWRPIRLTWGYATPGLDLTAVRLHATCRTGASPEGRLRVQIPWQGAADASLDGRVMLHRVGPDGVDPVPQAWAPLVLDPSGAAARADLVVPDVALWWPHTHGEPALYEVRMDAGGLAEASGGMPLGRVGFRDVVVRREAGDFALEINGQPVFARGACWTPLDVADPDRPPQEYGEAIRQVREAGMNMLRVGGTMVYEPKAFFAACDEAGVLVWQEFMFANMDFPDHDAVWLAGVETEVRQQLALWRSHPSVAVLCGNSEVEQQAAMWGAPREQWHSPLFHEHLPRWVDEDMPGAVYWPSSAHGGAYPHVVEHGTTSCYSVGAYLRPLEDARRQAPVWATECLAFANVPSPATIDRMPGASALRVTHPAWKQRSPRDLGAGWDFDDVRDHYLETWFGESARMLRYSDHERYLQLSRIVSGEVMAQVLAEWRRPGSRCRGALVWVLRDLWAGAGWGVLDDQGLPKPCWHLLRRVLAPRQVLWSDEGHSGLVAHLINERAESVRARLVVEAWQSRQALSTVEAELDVPARGHARVAVADLQGHFSDLTDVFRFGPRRHEAVRARWLDPMGAEVSRHWYLPGQGRHAVLDEPVSGPDAVCSATARRGAPDRVELTVTARRLLLWVHPEVPGWVSDDGYFHLAPGESRTVCLRPLPASALVPRVWRGLVRAVNLSAPAVIQFQEV